MLTLRRETYPPTEAFQRDWSALRADTPGDSIFSDLAWLEAGIRHALPPGRRPVPLRFVDGAGRTSAMALLQEAPLTSRLGTLRTLRTIEINSQRIPPLLAADADPQAEALIALWTEVGGHYDLVDLFKGPDRTRNGARRGPALPVDRLGRQRDIAAGARARGRVPHRERGVCLPGRASPAHLHLGGGHARPGGPSRVRLAGGARTRGIVSAPLVASARRLEGPADWEAWRPGVEALEAQCPPNPWAGLAYWHLCARLLEHRGCWALDVREEPDGPLVAAAVLREEIVTRARLSLRTLRGFDQVSFMRVPACLARGGDEARVAPALATALDQAARRAGADLVTLYRQDAATAEPLASALGEEGRVVRFGTWTRAAQIVLPEDLQAHLALHRAGLLQGSRRALRKLAREHGGEPRLETLRAHELDADAWRAARARANALLDTTWQRGWESQSRQVDPEVTRAFDEACLDLWRAQRRLELHFLVLPGHDGRDLDAALALTLTGEGRTWMLRIGYDPSAKAWSPGTLLLLRLVRALHARGERRLEWAGPT